MKTICESKDSTKKGFTLIELLVVIAILAVILMIAVPTILNNISKSKQKSYDNQVTLFVIGAEKYATEHNRDLLWEEEIETLRLKSIVTLQDLSDKGYMKLPVNNPLTNEAFDPETTLITVYKDNLGNYEFIFGDSAGLTITNGTINQTILQTVSYDNTFIMADISAKYNNEIVTGIEYTCKKNNMEINCDVLKETTKEIGRYVIT